MKKMRHVKSNVNILKPLQDKHNNINNNQNLKSSNSNNLLIKPKTSLILSEQNSNLKSINSKNNNFLSNIFDKSTKNSLSSILFNNNSNNIKNTISPNKKNSFNHKNNTYSYNNILTSKNNKKIVRNNNKNNTGNNKGISIRLNFKNKIINNNFSKRNNNNKNNKDKANNMQKNNIAYKSDFNVSEKIKEKDKQITLLQKDLLQSQKLLNQLQEEKQKEISSTYNSIKRVDSLINYNSVNTNNNSINSNYNNRMKKYSSLSNFFVTNTDKNLNILRTFYGKSSLKLNKSNSKRTIKNYIKTTNRIRKKNNLNLIIHTNPTTLVKFQMFKNNIQKVNRNCKTRNNIHKNYISNNYNSGSNSNIKKQNKNFLRVLSCSPNKILAQYLFQYESNHKTAKNTFRKNIYSNNKTIKSTSPSSAQNRVKHERIQKIINNNKRSKDLDYIINKGEEIKNRMKNLLDKYISLNYLIKKKYKKTEIQ